jgi:RimJ/RimL family protein N-acetyltransferase
MLFGNRVVLRPWAEVDLPVLSGIRNDLELQLALMSEPRPNSEGRVRQWLQDRSAQADTVFFVTARAADDHAVGFIQAHRIDRRNGAGYLGICLARDHQNEGLGGEAIQLLSTYLVEVMGLRKLMLEVLSDNQGAINFYLRAGFAVVGTLRAHHLMRGRFHDVIIMEKMLWQEKTL